MENGIPKSIWLILIPSHAFQTDECFRYHTKIHERYPEGIFRLVLYRLYRRHPDILQQQREHLEQVRKVLAKLKDAGLYAKPEKCEFSVEKTTFLGFVISADGIEMDPAKVEAIHNWEAPKCVKDVQCFLGFANFYRCFIYRYSEMCQPLFELLKKDTPLNWSLQCETVFKQLKIAFTSAPILCHFEPKLETILQTDASDYVVSGVLSQKHPHLETGKLILYPVAFMLEKMSPAKCNYGIRDKELLAIISSLEKWHIYLHQLP